MSTGVRQCEIMSLEWITNHWHPSVYSTRTDYAKLKEYQEFLKGKIIGPPKATVLYTVEQLEAKNIVGVYREQKAPQPEN